jgi:DNA-binding NarL/FixJ family response regulator
MCATSTQLEHWAVSPKKQLTTAEEAAPRILLADDCEEVGLTTAAILETEFRVVDLAKNGREVLDLIFKHSPNALVLDLFMPLLNGIETAERVKASGSPMAIVILTVNEDPDFLDAAMSAGALGYVLKPHAFTDLIPAVRAVLQGNIYVSPSMGGASPLPSLS